MTVDNLIQEALLGKFHPRTSGGYGIITRVEIQVEDCGYEDYGVEIEVLVSAITPGNKRKRAFRDEYFSYSPTDDIPAVSTI